MAKGRIVSKPGGGQMATAGYVERASNQISWGEIGVQVSDMLQAEAKRREDMKAEINEESRQAFQALQENPKGQSELLNTVSNNFLVDAQEQMLMTKRLLESGQMDLRQYMNIRKNMTDGTAQFYGNLQQLQDYVAEHNARAQGKGKDGRTSSNAETELMAKLGVFGQDLQNLRVGIDAEGVMSLNKMGEDGKIEENGILTMSQMTEGLNTFIDEYDMTTDMKKAEEALGEKVMTVVRNSTTANRFVEIEKITDKSQIPEYDSEGRAIFDFIKYKNQMIASKLADPMTMLSVLFDYDGEQDYTFCYDENCEDEKGKVRIDRSSGTTQYVFSEDQKTRAKDLMDKSFMSTLDVKVEKQAQERSRPPQRNTAEIEAGEEAQKKADLAKQWASLYYLPNDEKLTTIRSIINNPYVVKEIGLSKFEPVIENGVLTGIDVGYLDSRKDQVIPLDDLENMPYEKWVEIGSFIHGLAREEALEKAGKMPEGAQPDMNFSGTGAKRRGNVNKRKDLFDDWITKSVSVGEGDTPGLGLDENVFYNDEDVVISRLNKILPLITGKDGKPLYTTEKFTIQDGFYINDQSGETLFEFDTNLSSDKEGEKMKEQYNQLMNFLQTNLSSEKAEILYDRELGDKFIEEQKEEGEERRKKIQEKKTEEKAEENVDEETGGTAR